eukprot:5341098-Pleurochrysis_carterae.AAC.6
MQEKRRQAAAMLAAQNANNGANDPTTARPHENSNKSSNESAPSCTGHSLCYFEILDAVNGFPVPEPRSLSNRSQVRPVMY